MPRIDDNLLYTVFYIYPSLRDARDGTELGGTGFLFMIPSTLDDSKGFIYAITNAHVIFSSNNDEIYLRVYSRDGKFRIKTIKKKEWIRHPNGDDIAVCSVNLHKDIYKYGFFKREHLITKEYIEKNNVGVGDEIIAIGRFRVHPGKKRNLPTAMFGCISKMLEEPLRNPFTQCDQESFLIELRSIKGFSGSPIILYIQPFTNRFDGSTQISGRWEQRLLGIDWGHINYEVFATDEYNQTYKIKMDSAMAGVIPAWKILDLIDGDEFCNRRNEIEDQLQN